MQQIPVQDLAEAANPYAVDVRQTHEFVTGHTPGALTLPMSLQQVRYREFPQDRTVYLMCEIGTRNGQTTQALGAAGWDVVNVARGTEAWTRAGYPLEG